MYTTQSWPILSCRTATSVHLIWRVQEMLLNEHKHIILATTILTTVCGSSMKALSYYKGDSVLAAAGK
jgi:hypothetical protein